MGWEWAIFDIRKHRFVTFQDVYCHIMPEWCWTTIQETPVPLLSALETREPAPSARVLPSQGWMPAPAPPPSLDPRLYRTVGLNAWTPTLLTHKPALENWPLSGPVSPWRSILHSELPPSRPQPYSPERAADEHPRWETNLTRAPLGGGAISSPPPLVFLRYLLNQCRYHHQTCSTLSPNNFTHGVKILKSRIL